MVMLVEYAPGAVYSVGSLVRRETEIVHDVI